MPKTKAQMQSIEKAVQQTPTFTNSILISAKVLAVALALAEVLALALALALALPQDINWETDEDGWRMN